MWYCGHQATVTKTGESGRSCSGSADGGTGTPCARAHAPALAPRKNGLQPVELGHVSSRGYENQLVPTGRFESVQTGPQPIWRVGRGHVEREFEIGRHSSGREVTP